MAEGDYGKVEGTVTIGAVPVERNLVAISYAPFDIAGSDDGQGGLLQGRQVVGETTSAADGTYELQSLGFFDEVVVLAIENYGEVWKPNRSYVVGDRLRPTIGNETGYVYVVTIDGVSDPTEPTWWVNDGGNDTGAIGTATAQAIESWWSVAHAPITPTFVNGSAVVYPLELDPFYNDIITLLHMEGTNADTTFVDNAPTPLVWTATNEAALSTNFSSWGTTSLYLDGTADYLTIVSKSLFKRLHDGTGGTIEFRFRHDGAVESSVLFQTGGGATAKVGAWLGINADGSIRVLITRGVSGQPPADVTSLTGIIQASVDHHIALTVDSAGAKVWVDGALAASQAIAYPYSTADHTDDFTLGDGLKGNISDFRITAAVRHTAAFTPATAYLPDSRFAVGREPTILDAYFADVVSLIDLDGTDQATTDSDTITLVNWTFQAGAKLDGAVTKFGATSLKLIGSDGRVEADRPLLPASGDWTFEGWFYPTTIAGGNQKVLFSQYEAAQTGRLVASIEAGKLTFGGAESVGNDSVIANEWCHIAILREGDILKGYLNGIKQGEVAYTTIVLQRNTVVGAYDDVTNGWYDEFEGYISDIRVTEIARYTADFTPPTAAFPNFEYDPFENLAVADYPVVLDASFNFNFSLVQGDGDLTDVMGNTWLNVGTTISAIQSKWGAESIHFDGASGFYRIFDDTWLDVSGAFTVETWVYPLKNTSHSPIWSLGDTNNSANRFILSLKDGGRIQAYAEDSSVRLSIVSVGLPVTLSAWHHIALCSDGTTVYIFVDGLLEASAAWSGQAFVPSENTLRWGVGWLGGTHSWYEGYMSDTRLTHGVCRYTEGFVAPTAALPITRFEVGKEPTILDANWMDNISVLNFEEMADGTSVTDTFPTNPYGSNVWTATGNAGVAAGVLQLDGTGDSITHTDILALRVAFNRNDPGHDFTIEIKYKAGSTSAQQLIWGWQAGESNGLAVWQRDTDPTAIAFGVSDSGAGWDVFIATATATVVVGADIEVAITRRGDDYLMHVDGVYQGKGTFAGILNLGASGLGIGSASIIGDLLGDVYRFRSTLDVARYSESLNYTPDPGNSYIEYDPLEDLSLRTEVDPYFDSVVSLLHFDADLTTDVIAGNGWALKNTPVLATGQKYGSGCMDNSNVNGALRAVSGILIPPSGDWTIEMYFNPTAADLSGVHILVAQYTDAGAGRGSLRLNEGKLSMWSGSEGSLTEPTANTAGAWYHVAVVMSGGVLSLYKDGALVATADWSGYSPVQDETVIGAMIIDADTVSNPFGGKIDEFRATLLARYTTAFAVPTEAHPDSRYTYTE